MRPQGSRCRRAVSLATAAASGPQLRGANRPRASSCGVPPTARAKETSATAGSTSNRRQGDEPAEAGARCVAGTPAARERAQRCRRRNAPSLQRAECQAQLAAGAPPQRTRAPALLRPEAAATGPGAAQHNTDRAIASSTAGIVAGCISNSLSRTLPEHEGRNMASPARSLAKASGLPSDGPIVLPQYCPHSARSSVRAAGSELWARDSAKEATTSCGGVLPRVRVIRRAVMGMAIATQPGVQFQPAGAAGGDGAGRRLPHQARAGRRRLRHHLSRRRDGAGAARHHQGILSRRLRRPRAPPAMPRRARRTAPRTTSGASSASSRRRRRSRASTTPTSCASTATSAPTTPATWCCTSRRAAASRPG